MSSLQDLAHNPPQKLTRFLQTGIVVGAIGKPHLQGEICPTTIWNLIRLFTSLCGPLENVSRTVRLHIVMHIPSTSRLNRSCFPSIIQGILMVKK